MSLSALSHHSETSMTHSDHISDGSSKESPF